MCVVTAGGKSQHSSIVTDRLSVKKSADYLLMVTSATICCLYRFSQLGAIAFCCTVSAFSS